MKPQSVRALNLKWICIICLKVKLFTKPSKFVDIHVTIRISLNNHLRNWILQVKITSEGKIDILLKPKVSLIFPLFIELKLLSTGRGHHCIRAVKYTSGSLCLTRFCLWTRTLEINSVCGKTYNFSLMLCVSINSIICVLGYL